MRLLVTTFLVTFVIAVGAHAAPVPYQAKRLGMLEGVTSAKPVDINNGGEIVGIAYYGNSYWRACYWNPSGEMIDLEFDTDGTQSGARKINDLGQIIGDDNIGNAAFWNDHNSAPASLGPDISSTVDINNSGEIVGAEVIDGMFTGNVVRGADGEIRRIDQPEFWGISAINESGIMCGSTNYPCKAFICGTDGTLTWLQNVIGAYDINDNGQVLGSATNANGLGRGVIWNESGSLVWLEPIQGKYHSFGVAINNDGTVVGYSMTPGSQACLWTPQGELIDLGTLAGGSGSEAYAINDYGLTVGVSYDGATRYPVLWTPVPEPSSLIIVLGGLTTCAGVLRRQGSHLRNTKQQS